MLRIFDRRVCVAATLSLCLTIPAAAHDEARPVLVFAAASLKNALDEAIAAWARETSKTAKASYASLNALAKQIESAAPADLFLSADTAWMDHAQKLGAIRPETRSDLLRNAIVLVAPKGSAAQVTIAPGLGLAAALGGGRLAMANADAVPAGKYGKASLEKLGAWDGVKDRLA